MMKKLDYLIIGQGIAGSLLGWALLKRGKAMVIVDEYNPNSSSLVAAGIFNPITGRRFVKTWMADDLFPFAEESYQELEKELGQQVYHPRKIIRQLSDHAEWREWELKSGRPDYADYMNPLIQPGASGKVEILKGGNVDLLGLLKLMRERFQKINILDEIALVYNDLKVNAHSIEWKEYRADKLIFCEGIQSMNNPWFSHLPFTHAKGEILTIESQAFHIDYILSRGIFILPLGDDRYRVGSTYDWDDLSEKPTEKGKEELTKKLDNLIDVPYTIIDHRAGVRPTVRDRRPLIGLHPKYPALGIFNGMGTKGVSLAPYFANHFAEHLEDGKSLNPEVDIRRFY